MKLALAFGRLDVDAMLDELDHEQYVEWCAFVSTNPTGWDALNLAVARLAHAAVQPHCAKPLDESAFLIQLAAAQPPRDNLAADRLKMQLAEIRFRARGEMRDAI